MNIDAELGKAILVPSFCRVHPQALLADFTTAPRNVISEFQKHSSLHHQGHNLSPEVLQSERKYVYGKEWI